MAWSEGVGMCDVREDWREVDWVGGEGRTYEDAVFGGVFDHCFDLEEGVSLCMLGR